MSLDEPLSPSKQATGGQTGPGGAGKLPNVRIGVMISAPDSPPTRPRNSKLQSSSSHPDRRQFVATGTAALGAAAVSPSFGVLRAGRRDKLRVAVVGTGGRGGGACNDHLTANDDVVLVAMADLDPAKCKRLRESLLKRHPEKVAVEDSSIYGGLDGFRKVIQRSDIDVVLLTTSPGFRPEHVKAAVAAKKHVFAEKPVCVDAAGYRACLEADALAREQGTAIVTGTQYRRQPNYMAAVDHIHKGTVGEPIAMTARYCSTGIWYRKRKPGMSDAEYQLHNWMHFIWLSGDQIVEQAVHNIDLMNWVFKGPPVSAFGSGGRFTRPDDSEMWDSMSIDYSFDGDKLASFACRQIPGATSDAHNVIYCTGGKVAIKAINGGSKVYDDQGKVVFELKSRIGDAYRQEHKDLADSIRAGAPIVELKQTADSSLTAVLGRVAAYTGKLVKWDFLTEESKLDLFPKDLAIDGELKSAGPAIPGRTRLI